MSGGGQPRDVDAEEISSRLSEALDSCRSMMSNYRAMLSDRVPAENCRNEPGKSEPPGAA